MKKYIVESLSIFRNVHVIETDNEEDIKLLMENSDANHDQWLGSQLIDVTEYSDQAIERFASKQYFYHGSSFIDDEGYVCYRDKNGQVRRSTMDKVK